jgi:polysaccharide deacetylase family protein (PEP-CTERM system associated)
MGKATLSIDWEDFGQLYGMYHQYGITEPVKGSIERQTAIMLDLLDETGVKATFFVLGMLAKYRPQLVKDIHARGHEIALHGQNHRPMFTLNPEEARADVQESLQIVTDIIGAPVYGYRAPFFSIIAQNLYLLDVLADLGLMYDSSIFPVKTARYGIENFSPENKLYELPNGKELVELPLTTATFAGKKWPVAGGGYIRLMPRGLVSKVFKSLRNKDTMIYMHPYEFDNRSISVADNYPSEAKNATLKVHALNLRWNLFRSTITGKIRMLLNEYQYITCLEKAQHVKTNGNRSKLLGCTQ